VALRLGLAVSHVGNFSSVKLTAASRFVIKVQLGYTCTQTMEVFSVYSWTMEVFSIYSQTTEVFSVYFQATEVLGIFICIRIRDDNC